MQQSNTAALPELKEWIRRRLQTPLARAGHIAIDGKTSKRGHPALRRAQRS